MIPRFFTLLLRARTTLCGLLALAILLLSQNACAHAIGLSTGEYTAHGSTLVGKLAFARNEVAQLAPMIDRNRDGHITANEVGESKLLLTEKIIGHIHVTQMGAECTPTLDDAGLTEQDGLLMSARWTCGSSDKAFTVSLDVLDDLSRGHRHVARAVSGETTNDQVLFGDERKFDVAPGDGKGSDASNASGPDGSAPPSTKPRSGFGSFFLMGIEHILTGYDHLVFIFGLLLVPARFRSLLATITAFTIAHSVTLGLAALDVWTPSARIIEPAIALSIAYVGFEDFAIASGRFAFKPDPEKRWRITFPFGLIHGFGFASALKEAALAKASIPAALVAFNLGVESGQLAVLSVVLPIVIVLRKKAWFADRGVKALSVVVIVAGLVWFAVRVAS